MGYTVRFFALDWDSLTAVLRGEKAGLYDEVWSGRSRARLTSAIGRGHDTQEALQELLGGSLGQAMAARGPQPPDEVAQDLSEAHALAWMAILEHLGLPAGELLHNSLAGTDFRDHFLDVTLPSALAPFDWYLLVDRPLFGVTYLGYPTWGGMRVSEYAPILAQRGGDGVPELEDSDEQDWLDAVLGALEAAEEAKMDLVSLYF